MHRKISLLIVAILLLMPLTSAGSFAKPLAQGQASYWIWAGIDVPEKSRTKNLFVYQGAFLRNKQKIEFARKGLYPHRLVANEVHLVFRLDALDASEQFRNTILMIISHWEQKKTAIRGIQLDFDSPTGKLGLYALFLEQVRTWLPLRYALTITGLGDWLLLDRPELLRVLSACTDEIVFQLYLGRRYVPGLESYVAKLQQLAIPFRIGLLPERENNKQIEDALRSNPYFRGSIYFIQAS